METITFNCRFITPAFLGGADPNGTPELRAPSIKGALRFWWRAMNGHLPIEALKKAEESVFGSTEKRSSIIVRTSHPECDFFEEKWFQFNNQSKPATKYLFFTTLLKGNEERKALPEKSEFKVQISAMSNNTLALKQSVCSFWLWAHFGGIGMRSRRGGGNFMTMPDNNLNIDGLTFTPLQNESINQYLERNIKICIKTCYVPTESPNSNQEYSSMKGAWIVSKKEKSGILRLGDYFKEFRAEKTGDENLLKKAAFGLPLTSTMPPKRRKPDHTEVIIGDGSFDRRSSPIILRELIFSEQRYWIAIWLKGQLFPATLNLRYIYDKSIAISNKQESDIFLTEFMNFLKTKGGSAIHLNKI